MIRQVEHGGRRIDGLIVYPDGRRKAIEAKTSRADFQRETDAKRHASWTLADECYYAAPSTIISTADLPYGWGLLHVRAGGATAVAPATSHGVRRLSHEDVARLAGRLAHLERRLSDPQDAEERAAALAVDVERLEGLLAAQRAATAREVERANQAAEQVLLARGEDLYCVACNGLLAYTRVHGWRHRSKGLDETCDAQRAEAERRRREVLTGAAYVAVEPPRIRPSGRPAGH